MTDIRRTLLWVVFSMSLFLIWDAWKKHNGQPSFFSPRARGQAGAGRRGARARRQGAAPGRAGAVGRAAGQRRRGDAPRRRRPRPSPVRRAARR